MRRLTIAALAAAALLAGAVDCDGDDAPPTDTLNCDDFENRDQAQRAYEQARQTTEPDPHRLDDDGDGAACETTSYPRRAPQPAPSGD